MIISAAIRKRLGQCINALLPHCFYAFGDGLSRSIVPQYLLAAGVIGQSTNMAFKSVVREKRSDTVHMRVLYVCLYPEILNLT
jgi:hypothetical protein